MFIQEALRVPPPAKRKYSTHLCQTYLFIKKYMQ